MKESIPVSKFGTPSLGEIVGFLSSLEIIDRTSISKNFNFIFVLDYFMIPATLNGEMEGPKYQQLYSAIRFYLEKLNPERNLDKFKFCWAPSHCDIHLNEEADLAAFSGAKCAQNKDTPRYLIPPLSPISYKISELADFAAQNRWNNSEVARNLFYIKPNFSTIYTAELNQFISTIINRLSTGTCGLKLHHSWQLSDPNQDLNCPNCNHYSENVEHFLLHCPSYESIRNKMIFEIYSIYKVGDFDLNLKNLLGNFYIDESSPNINKERFKFLSVVKFVILSNRLPKLTNSYAAKVLKFFDFI